MSDPYAGIGRAVVEYGPGNPKLEGQGVTPEQASAARSRQSQGMTRPDAPAGSPGNPYYSRTNADIPQGAHFVDTAGATQVAQGKPQTYQDIGRPVPGVAEDVLKSIPTGLLRGGLGLENLLANPGGDMQGLLRHGAAGIAGRLSGATPEQIAQAEATLNRLAPLAPTSDQMMDASGINYHAQTVPGQYVQTAAEFAPNAIGGPEGLLPKLLSVAAPAVASETAGQLTKGTKAEPWARMLTAIAAGGATGARAGAQGALPKISEDLAAMGFLPDVTRAQAGQALRYVGGKVKAAGPDALQPSQYPVTAAEALGKPGEVGLASLARQQGKTPDLVQAQFAERAEQRGQRILDGVHKITGVSPESARGDIEAIIKTGQDNAAPLYDAVRANPNPIINPELAALSRRPVIQKAMRAEYESALNAGRDPQAMGMRLTTRSEPETATTSGVVPARKVEEWVEFTAPTADTWDRVKKALSYQVERNPTTGKPVPDSVSLGNHDISAASAALTDALKKHVPGYREAVETAGDYKTVEGAYNRGRGWLFGQGKNQTPTDFAKLWGSLKSPAEQDAVRSAIASDLFDAERKGLLSIAKLKRPAIQDKLRLAFGDDAATKLTEMVGAEGKMQGAERLIMPGAGSQTDPLRAERALQGGSNVAGEMAADFLPHAMLGSPKSGAVVAVGRQLGKAVAPLRTMGMSEAARDQAGAMLQMSPEELKALLERIHTAVPPRTPVSAAAAPVSLGFLSGLGATASQAGQ